MKTRRANWLTAAALMAGLGLSGSAHAVWTFNNANVSSVGNYTNCSLSSTPNCDNNSSNGSTNESGAKINDVTVGLTGYHAVNSNGVVTAGNTWIKTAANQNNNGAAGLAYFSGAGQGMYTGGETTSPYHALDNNVNTEAVLLSFSSKTALTSIGLGYTDTTGSTVEIGCRSAAGAITTTTAASCANGTTNVGKTVDVSLFRWTGGNAPTLAGAAGTLGGSWELVGNYGDMITDTSNPYNLVNSSGKTSSWWLISAYNSGFTQSAGRETRGTLNNSNDYFKLFAVAGTVCTSNLTNGQCGGTTVKVPEPASLALTSVALLSVAGLRRRKGKSAA